MAYKVLFSDGVDKEFRGLDRVMQKRIAKLIERIQASDNPRFSGKALQGNDRQWRYRVGDYRLVCEIRDKELIVYCIKVGHRRDVYK